MKKLKNGGLANGIFGDFFAYYQSHGGEALNTYEQFAESAQEFIRTVDNDTRIKELLAIEFEFSEEEIEFPQEMKSSGKLRFVIGLERLYTALQNVFYKNKVDTIEYHGFERQAAPPKEAYDRIGHNDADITPSKRSYSLMVNNQH